MNLIRKERNIDGQYFIITLRIYNINRPESRYLEDNIDGKKKKRKHSR